MQRQRLQEGLDQRRRGTADHHAPSNFERESDKFQQLRRRICQSQKGGPRSTRPQPSGRGSMMQFQFGQNAEKKIDHFPQASQPSDMKHEEAIHLPPANSRGNLPGNEPPRQPDAPQHRRKAPPPPPAKERVRSSASSRRR